MIDNIGLSETRPGNNGLEDMAIPLSAVQAALTDTDDRDVLAVAINALPFGAALSDGSHSFTAAADATQADSCHLTWQLDGSSEPALATPPDRLAPHIHHPWQDGGTKDVDQPRP